MKKENGRIGAEGSGGPVPRRACLAILAVGLLGIGARSEAAVVLVPSGLNAGDPYHLIFVSSTRSTANFGGIAGADTLVQGLANAAGVGVTQGISWQAVLSDSTTSAISRFNPAAPIYDMQGNRVAASGAALWNAASVPLENPIAFDETGSGGIFIEVWTGTSPAGILQQADSDWTSANSFDTSTSGLASSTGAMWMNGVGTAEDVPQSIYAVSSQLLAPAVPEPSRGLLLLLGLVTLVLRRR